ncbi:MAG: hydrolase [Lachnospiraceae bacterium]|nr:hydrolase [Lachnospiraceae bacterium]
MDTVSRDNDRNTDERFRCPCCGYYTLQSPGAYEICPVCFWEDDPVQEDDPDLCGGANEPSLNECRENYRKFNACEERFRDRVREPYLEEIR